MDTETKQFRNSLVQYLKATLTSSADVDAALKLISEQLGVDSSAPATTDLFALFKQHAPKTPEPAPSAKAPDAAAEAKFEDYKKLIASRGYFQGCEEGSPTYNDRLTKARERFFAKFYSSQPATSTPAPAAVSTPTPVSISGMTDAEREAKGNEHKTKANNLLVERKWQESLNEYNLAIQYFDKSAIFYANRAVPLARLGQHKEAIEDCLKAINLDPKYAKAYARLGANYQTLKKYPEAIQAFKNGLALEPDNAAYRNDLAKAEAELAATQAPPAAANPNAGINAFQQMMNGLGGMDGQGGSMPGMPGIPGMGAGGVPPNFMEMMSDPRFMNMAQQMVMSNPQLRELASQVAQNPELLSQMMSGQIPNSPQFGEQLASALGSMGGPEAVQNMMSGMMNGLGGMGKPPGSGDGGAGGIGGM